MITYWGEELKKSEASSLRRQKTWPRENDYDEDGYKGYEAVFENGSMMEETPYVDGRKHGISICYHDDGSKYLEIPYVKGKEQVGIGD